MYQRLTIIIVTAAIPVMLLPLKSSATAQPKGEAKQTATALLETGSKLMQNFDPLKGYNVYLVGFHPLKDDPHHQMIAYHYCKQVNEDFMQCMLFDSNTEHANLTGIEYIISEQLFNKLPKEERKYWHPHNYEILSGQLAAPGIPSAIEKQFMKKKINSYGKTWHTWMTHNDLPLGDANLAWSFNHDGEIDPTLIQQRDKKLNISTKILREQRQDLIKLAKPQQGADAIAESFEGGVK